MRNQTVQDMVAVLPHSFDYDERRVFRNIAEDLHSIFLRIDKAVMLDGIEGVGATNCKATIANRFR
ncbi:MAG: hypothetical protein JOZ62_04140, partial [Acidobacteriaceae bacterium]|nr:hypothetical protein [Acidobacteriaceae bacterium]